MVLLIGEVPVLRLESLHLVGELLPGAVATSSLLLEITAGQADGFHLGLEPSDGTGGVVSGANVAGLHVILLVDDIYIVSHIWDACMCLTLSPDCDVGETPEHHCPEGGHCDCCYCC